MRLSQVVLIALAVGIGMPACSPHAQTELPTFVHDPSWPKPLPGNWRLGIVWGVAVDPQDHVWVLHAPDNYRDEIEDEGKLPAPPVLEFDPEGNLLRSWGGRDQGYPWFYRMDSQRLSRVDEHPHPVREHALNVDHEGNIWISGGGHLVLKFSPDGEFLLQIGELGMTGGSDHKEYLGNPSNVDFDPRTNEVYIADGYLNKRVVVYDMDSGEYKRHWGRYGEPPDDSFEAGPLPAWSGFPGPTGFFPASHMARTSRTTDAYTWPTAPTTWSTCTSRTARSSRRRRRPGRSTRSPSRTIRTSSSCTGRGSTRPARSTSCGATTWRCWESLTVPGSTSSTSTRRETCSPAGCSCPSGSSFSETERG